MSVKVEEDRTVMCACPKCGNTEFKIEIKHFAEEKSFFDIMKYKAEVCTDCGWRSFPDDEDEAYRRVSIILELAEFKDRELRKEYTKRFVDWEGFKFVDKEAK